MSDDLPHYSSLLEALHLKIRRACADSGRSPKDVTLVAVSKTKPASAIEKYLSLGQLHFGENYVQEALAKQNEVRASLDGSQPFWHFIGHLQSNKAKQVAGKFHLIHGLDSLSLAQKLQTALAVEGKTQNVLVEVNVDGESTKAGVAPEDLFAFLESLGKFSHLSVKGLMCIPAPSASSQESRRPFAKLRDLLEAANKNGAYGNSLTELSMGMSSDFEAALLEGATLIRVGTALFGPRT
jgi:PLP dependent protein